MTDISSSSTHTIDRLAPTRRPDERVRGYQEWRNLLFLHWEVPVEILRPLVPSTLDLDLFNGKAYIGLVPFEMQAVRPAWCPRSLGFDFLETNVRTYVYHRGAPGVYFFSLDAASAIAVWTARTLWRLPYFRAQMSVSHADAVTKYQLKRAQSQAELSVEYCVKEPLGTSLPESLEFFFLERYLLFVERGQQLYAGQVHHVPYPACRAEVLSIDDAVLSAAGICVGNRTPDHVHFSPGVDVEIFALRPATP